MGKEFLVNNKLCGKDCGELVLVHPGDSLDVVSGVAASSHSPIRSC